MARDELNKPLGLNPPSPKGPAFRLPWRAIGWAGGAAFLAGVAGFVVMRDDGSGGRAIAVAQIERPAKASAPDKVAQGPATRPPAINDVTGAIPGEAAAGGELSVEIQNGVRIVRPTGNRPTNGMFIPVPDSLEVKLAGPDKRLTEKGRYGPLPRVAADGTRPLEAYARPLASGGALKVGAPRIVLLVGGMGISETATASALEQLPGAVTLAFAPYGAGLERSANRARELGHEIVLQAPMEAFEGVRAEALPHQLQTALDAPRNLDHLDWLMSRFQGYVAVMNFLGGKFTASETSLSPVMRAVADRGLAWLDDGSSPQSMAPRIAAAGNMPFAQVDIVIDAQTRPDAIETALARLESLARDKGIAVGVANGLPATIERVARFARALEGHGIRLIPLSAAVTLAPRVTGSARP